ncbi:hypothetical protein GCM10007049_02030 [Echinicola pacifica]|uniref:Streptomycin biosynthesis protein StrF domain-containing protein n=1 Tax=Echinicola pacifica TaxID=346377 RepID=A0A918PL24_9BACT|nr:glycosyltransferase [Echinicola pacifica]GGZ13809.1 hypothetical protein GCM10007049_02030 [Echinicola pacifica]
MISIIICSANSAYLSAVKLNIAQTIGCEHEILAYDNSMGERGICEVYNQGAAAAKYELLCFMHEDIEYKTADWGQIVRRIFSDNPSLGLLGVAGGDYKSLAPSSWFNFGHFEGFQGKYYMNLEQGFKFKDKETIRELRNPNNEVLSKVACIDGVWMCTPKKIFDTPKFDELMLKGFHGYDLDYSLAVNSKGFKVAVTFEVLFHHFSEGKYDGGWFKDIVHLHKKWASILPLNTAKLSPMQIPAIEKRMFRHFFNDCLNKGYSKWGMMKILFHSRKSVVMTPVLLLKLFFSILKR